MYSDFKSTGTSWKVIFGNDHTDQCIVDIKSHEGSIGIVNRRQTLEIKIIALFSLGVPIWPNESIPLNVLLLKVTTGVKWILSLE